MIVLHVMPSEYIISEQSSNSTLATDFSLEQKWHILTIQFNRELQLFNLSSFWGEVLPNGTDKCTCGRGINNKILHST